MKRHLPIKAVTCVSVVCSFLLLGACEKQTLESNATAQYKIAFTFTDSLGEALYSVNPDGSDLKKIQTVAGIVYWLSWSPNGEKILISIYGIELWILNRDGSGLVRIDSLWQFSGGRVSWSPDGTQLVFNCGGQICRANADGSGAEIVITNGSFSSLAPDGAKIAFRRDSALYVANSDGSNPQMITDSIGFDSWSRILDGLIWSPSGDRIAYTDDGDIIVVHADGSNKMNIRSDGANNRFPAWSPDGTMIAFASRSDPGGIIIVNLNDTSKQQVTERSDDSYPQWSPDGKKIAFVNNDGIHVMNPDGSAKITVTERKLTFGIVAWSPVPLPD